MKFLLLKLKSSPRLRWTLIGAFAGEMLMFISILLLASLSSPTIPEVGANRSEGIHPIAVQYVYSALMAPPVMFNEFLRTELIAYGDCEIGAGDINLYFCTGIWQTLDLIRMLFFALCAFFWIPFLGAVIGNVAHRLVTRYKNRSTLNK